MRPLCERIVRAAEGGMRLLFPPTCVHCRGIVEDESPMRMLCARCIRGIHHVKDPCCDVCGHPFFGEMVEDQCCAHCTQLKPVYRQGRTAVLFRGPVGSLVLELKYHRGTYVAGDIREIFTRAREVLEFVRDSVLVPVPLHPRKERERGYNQTRIIARALADASGGAAEVQELLKRTMDTVTQTAFDRSTRAANLKNAFALAAGVTINPKLHYIIIDDVFTTGSTLNSCAQVLNRAGCVRLDIVTLAHG